MSIQLLKPRHQLMVLVLSLAACAPKTDTAPPDSPAPAVDDKGAGEAAKEDGEAAKEDGEDDAKADAKADAKDDAKADAPAKAEGGGDLLAVLAANPKTKTFSELLPLSDFGKGLHGTEGGGLTILAPTDDAFAKLPKGTVERLKKHPAELDALIRYHVVLGKNDVNKLTGFRTAPTASGKELEVKTQDNDVTIAGARLLDTDLPASNGIIHTIDRVLSPKKK
jgi:uncharacterized surface protein with fasciclin (FAS1) repeats